MPKSRDHGQGALYWDPSKKLWRAVIDVGFDPLTGKRLQVARMGKTKEAVVKKLNVILRKRDTLGRVLDRSVRVSELADRWLADVSTRAKPRTLANYRSNLRSKIVPTLGTRVITDLTPTDVRRMHTSIRRTGVGDAALGSAHRTLVTMLEYARAERILNENVAALTPPRRAQAPKTRDSLSREDARDLLQIHDPRWTLGLLTGIRSGEARALRWSDVDFEARVASLPWSLTEADFAHGCGGACGKQRAGNCPKRQVVISEELEWLPLQDRHVLVRPKNGKPREVPLTSSMVVQLQALRHAESLNPHDLVWHREDGSPRTNDDDNDHLRSSLS